MSNSQHRVAREGKRHGKRTARLVTILATVSLLLGLGVVFTQASRQNSAPGQQKKTYVGTKEIIVDKQTGKARKPTPQETEELVDQLKVMTNRSTEGLSVETRAGGIKAVEIDGRFAPVTVARPAEDGSMEVRCVSTFEEAAAFLGLEEAPSNPQE